MIETWCSCGAAIAAPEETLDRRAACMRCQKAYCLVAAEALPDGGGAADFDARLLVAASPQSDLRSAQFFIGGVVEILIGKLADKNIQLPGERVSRFHCRLIRMDFGPS